MFRNQDICDTNELGSVYVLALVDPIFHLDKTSVSTLELLKRDFVDFGMCPIVNQNRVMTLLVFKLVPRI